MKYLTYLSFLVLVLTACSKKNSEKVWVYLELAIDNKDTTDEYVYGQISAGMLSDLKSNKSIERLFTLENIRYISLQDSIEVEEDEDLVGTSTYYLKDVRKIDEYKVDPLFANLGFPLSKRSEQIKSELLKLRK
jgi:hypothetical protein